MLVSALQKQFIIRIFNWCTSRRADLIEIPDRIRFITGALITIAPTDDGWWFALSLLLIRPENIFSLAHPEKMEMNVSLCWQIPLALTHKLTHPSVNRVWTIRTQRDKCMRATNERLLNVSTETPQRQNLVTQPSMNSCCCWHWNAFSRCSARAQTLIHAIPLNTHTPPAWKCGQTSVYTRECQTSDLLVALHYWYCALAN